MPTRPTPLTRLSAVASLAFVATALAPHAALARQSAPKADVAPPVTFAGDGDHRNMMERLGIKTLRPGADPNDQTTFDEKTANPYPLPDLMTMKDGTKVTTPERWAARRAEILDDFEREVYGRIPANVPKVEWRVAETLEGSTAGVQTITKTLVGHVDNSAYPAITVDIRASLTTPKYATGPVPVMVEFDAGWGRFFKAPPGPTWQELLIAKGWGFATITPQSIQADGPQLTSGVIGLTNHGQPRKPDDWGALRAWQWGFSRLLDYFETDKAVDAKQVGIEGLSRYGKAALVTAAFEPRTAVAFVGSSGEGGAKPHRRIYGELVENLTSSGEYHWMAGNFLKYGAAESSFGAKTAADIPVDAHELIAACAPRPVFVSYGVPERGDAPWVDARGAFMATVAAGPAYRLLGKRDLGTAGNYLTDPMPPVEKLIGGELAWRQHTGGHSVAENWPAFVEWAGQFLHGPPVTAVAATPVFAPKRASGIYDVGETVSWTVSLPPGATAKGPYAYAIRRDNMVELASGTIDFAKGPATIEAKVDRPAMVFAEVRPADEPKDPQGKPAGLGVAGAAVAPTRIEPSQPRPADFDAFWRAKLAELAKVPANPTLTPKDSGDPGVEYATIRMENLGGGHIYGQLARPRTPGKHPALLMLQWASPPYPLQRDWVTDPAKQGYLTLNIEPHDVLPDRPQAYYDALPDELKHYESIGRDDREENYFLRMYLADYRAVEWLAGQPDWDGKTLVVMGTSMGGQQSLSVAGLNPRITHVIVNEPAGCDANGALHGRASGYPFWPADDPKAMATAPYFDPVNFASNITAKSLVAMGYVDTVAPPVGIYAAFNQIKGPKEAAPMVASPHNNLATAEQQRPWTTRSARWLDTIARGGDPVGASAEAADRPSARTDKNSRLAHEQLLAKTRAGGVDLYFLGDSITRRWGTSDEAYRDFYQNWKWNFFGWNAGDFGWGGDTTQNVLWRIQNGELETVKPKVIVLMIGTNNVGSAASSGPDDPRIADVSKGIAAIVSTCGKLAPNATIVLMGITPRNDNVAVMPVIDAINSNISKLADGKTVRFVNINDKLADANGRFYDGMANADGLHLDVGGYQVWAQAIKPILTEVLGPPAKTDHAPPPTGDPEVRGTAR